MAGVVADELLGVSGWCGENVDDQQDQRQIREQIFSVFAFDREPRWEMQLE